MLFKTLTAAALLFSVAFAAPMDAESSDLVDESFEAEAESIQLEARGLKQLSWSDIMTTGIRKIRPDGSAVATVTNYISASQNSFVANTNQNQGTLCVRIEGFKPLAVGYQAWLIFGGGNLEGYPVFRIDSWDNSVLTTAADGSMKTIAKLSAKENKFCAKMTNSAGNRIAELSINGKVLHTTKRQGTWSNIYVIARTTDAGAVAPSGPTTVIFKRPTLA